MIAETEYQYAPLRIFDLQPALDGERTNINRPDLGMDRELGESRAQPRGALAVRLRVRLPGRAPDLQPDGSAEPRHPWGITDTYVGSPNDPDFRYPMFNGTFGVDVRNEDGLIVVSDMSTGLWTFKMEGFNGWNGEDWGMPDISSVQKWDGPRPRPVSER